MDGQTAKSAVDGLKDGFMTGYSATRQIKENRKADAEESQAQAKKDKLAKFHSELFQSNQPTPETAPAQQTQPIDNGMAMQPPVQQPVLTIPGSEQRISGMVQSAGGPAMQPIEQPPQQVTPKEPPDLIGQMDNAVRVAFTRMSDPEYADIQPEILDSVDKLVNSTGRVKDLMYSQMRAKSKPDLMTLYNPGASPEEKGQALSRLMSNYPDGRNYHAVVTKDGATLLDENGVTTQMTSPEMDEYVSRLLASPDSMFEMINEGIKARKEEATRQTKRGEDKQDAKELEDYKDSKDDGELVDGDGGKFVIKDGEAMPVMIKGSDKQLQTTGKPGDTPNDQQMIEYMITPDETGKTIAPDRASAYKMLKSGTTDVAAVAQRMATSQFEAQRAANIGPNDAGYVPYDTFYENSVQQVRKYSTGGSGGMPGPEKTGDGAEDPLGIR